MGNFVVFHIRFTFYAKQLRTRVDYFTYSFDNK